MQGRPTALFETYDSIVKAGMSFPVVPKYVKENLAHSLRPYQEEAIGRWLHYMDRDAMNKKLPVQLLFNMATGSGKTLIMAALILDLYKRGYRNFVFFVNSTNIIEKTRDNFTTKSSTKYLFSDNILINGEHVEVKDVTNFSDGNDDAINIVFTTIQGLHTDLNNPRENRLSYSDFEDKKVVLIGDEAHHNNSKTMLDKDQLEDNRSWESTIDNIMSVAGDAILLEFTATMDLDDASIYRKYYDRIIYKYDLKAFRADGYSKDVMIYHVDSDIESRMLQAIIISQYRKKVALRNGIWLKPVVLFKSKTIAENKQNYELFTQLINNLTIEKIEAQKKSATSILAEAFNNINLVTADLVEELKLDFMPERLVLIDGNNIAGDKQLQLNSLEDRNNEIRAVFAVDMLNEGWDVLNLFDIVRLYDTRDAKDNKPGKTTIREAQLIGRGARYYPFVTDDPDKKYTRKFDHNENEELRLIEQLHYHSANNPKYIQEIRQALITSGLLDENYIEQTLTLKKSFKETETYKSGVVYVNDRITKTESNLSQASFLAGFDFSSKIIEVDLPTNIGVVTTVFDDLEEEKSTKNIQKDKYEFEFGKEVSKHIIRHAMACNKVFRFNYLTKKVSMISSAEEFMNVIGKIRISASGIGIGKGKFTPGQQLYIANQVLTEIELQIEKNDDSYEGTKTFEAKKISEVFQDNIKRKYHTKGSDSDQEFGISQAWSKNEKYALDLSKTEWYAYNDNYGTSEEKSLVVTIDGMFKELAENWTDIYLLRNEKAITIYSFDGGRAFEPDFILIANDKKSGNISWQIFIEPKGGQLMASDSWKEEFLIDIAKQKEVKTLAENENIKIIGLPFYNENTTKKEFIDELSDLNKEAK